MKPTTYRELQAALKTLRNEGYDIQVKLNASFETLQAEYNRLTQANLEPTIEMTTEEFNEWVGFPKEAIAQLAPEKAKDIPKTLMQPLSDLNNFGKQRTKQLQAMQDKGLVIQANSIYWIDGTELKQKLDSTQVQALRNLEDGLIWLQQLRCNIKAFHDGFRQGWQDASDKRSHRPMDKAKVIQLDRTRSRSLKVA